MDRGTFESEWPRLETQLRAALVTRRIPADAREDILQETALRLLRSWDHVRHESLWAFALTVTLNIVRDEARKKERRDRSGYGYPVMDRDPEHEALVRIELERVRAAFGSLNQRQRTILLGEIGEAALEASTPAQKMARMRARRRLRSLLEDASGVIALSYLKIRRVIGDTDAAFAGTAARLGMRVAALATVAAVTAPVAGGDSSAAPIRPAEPPAVERDVVAHRSTSGAAASRVPLSPEPDDRSSGRFTGDATVAGERLNRHFGVIHRDDESIAVGGEPRVGPYGAEHSVAHEIAGSMIGAGAEARFDRTRCLNERLQQPHSRCRGNGRLRARARAVVNETGHEASVDTLVVPN